MAWGSSECKKMPVNLVVVGVGTGRANYVV